jgi:hypothetical protein
MEGSSVPARPDQPHEQGVGHWVLVVLGVVAAAQLMFLLLSLILMALGGGTGLQFILLVIIEGGALSGILWLIVAIRRRRVKVGTAFLALAVPLADVVLVALLVAGFLGGSCTDEEVRLSNEIPSFGAVDIDFDYEAESGACAGSLAVTASADDVLAHYQRELEDDGWSVRVEETPAEPAEGEPVIVRELTAHRGTRLFTIALESSSGETTAAIRIDA